MFKNFQLFVAILLLGTPVFAIGSQETLFDDEMTFTLPAKIKKDVQKLFSYPVILNEDKPFGFDLIYTEGSYLSHFENPNQLEIVFPANVFGPEESGYNFQAKLPPSDAKIISYDVMFDQDFDFVKGGKLPGLCGGKGATGGDKATGQNGFSSRICWKEDGRAISYVYHANQKENYGDELQWKASPDKNFSFPRKTWKRIRMIVKMNDIGESNGMIKVSVDGKIVFRKNDFVFRTVETLQIDRLCFNAFFGGADDSWAPKKQEKLHIRNFEIEE